MNNHIPSIILKHKQLITLSIVVIALTVYIFPVDSLFTHQATAQRTDQREDRAYGRFGPAPGHGGQNPGNEGGSPPGNTPGGSNTPPGQQRGQ